MKKYVFNLYSFQKKELVDSCHLEGVNAPSALFFAIGAYVSKFIEWMNSDG